MCHFGQREGGGVWDFKGTAGDSQAEEKEQACDEEILAGHRETMPPPQGASGTQALLGDSPLTGGVYVTMLSDVPFL